MNDKDTNAVTITENNISELERYKILLINVIGELYENVFEVNIEETEKWLLDECGMPESIWDEIKPMLLNEN